MHDLTEAKVRDAMYKCLKGMDLATMSYKLVRAFTDSPVIELVGSKTYPVLKSGRSDGFTCLVSLNLKTSIEQGELLEE